MNDKTREVGKDTVADLLVVGAGPTGMACAIEAKRAGFREVLVDKGCICNSLFHYPAHMTFFTTSELLEIGGIPFPSPNAKPTRTEALEYYRQVAAHYRLDVRQYQRVESISGADGAFTAHLTDRFGRQSDLTARKLAISIGYYDLPNWMGVPGEMLSKVHHYYHDPHPYFEMNVAVIGGKNSAAIAALELWRHGARVTVIYRGAAMHRTSSTGSNRTSRIGSRTVRSRRISRLRLSEITPDRWWSILQQAAKQSPTTLYFAMTGYHPDFTFLERLGVHFEGSDRLPVCNAETLESNVPGIYLAGVIVAGSRTNEIFIENGRFHGGQIAAVAGFKTATRRCHERMWLPQAIR